MGNNIITWETSTNLNFGLDVNVLDNRLRSYVRLV